MRKHKQTLALAAALMIALLAAPALYAQDSHKRSDSTKRGGMMGNGNMMGRTSRMMDQCGSMMQGGPRGDRPNDQWRKDAPAKPEKGE